MRFVGPWIGVALSGEPARACHPGVILGRGALRGRGWCVIESVGVPGGNGRLHALAGLPRPGV